MYVNKIENRITWKIKTGYYFKLLTPETTKLLGSTEHKITKGRKIKLVKMYQILKLQK